MLFVFLIDVFFSDITIHHKHIARLANFLCHLTAQMLCGRLKVKQRYWQQIETDFASENTRKLYLLKEAAESQKGLDDLCDVLSGGDYTKQQLLDAALLEPKEFRFGEF